MCFRLRPFQSEDGIHWDEGLVLMSRMQTPGGGDCYSDSEIVGKQDRPAVPERDAGGEDWGATLTEQP